jgi:hypothetical protein
MNFDKMVVEVKARRRRHTWIVTQCALQRMKEQSARRIPQAVALDLLVHLQLF